MVKEPHFTPQRMLNMLGLKPNSLGPYALMPGPKERSEIDVEALGRAAKELHFSRLRDAYRRRSTASASRIGNGGRYAPDTAITTEILCGAGAESLIRVGSCGSLQDDVKIGDLVIVTGALRGDGTSRYYVAENFSTVADPDIVAALEAGGGRFASALIISAGSSPPTRCFKRRRN